MRITVLLAAIAAALAITVAAGATAPPITILPEGPISTITTTKGSLVSIALRSRAGKSWRLARQVNSKVLVEVGEANVGKNVVVIFRATGKGKTTVVYGLTRGESKTATASATYRVTVS